MRFKKINALSGFSGSSGNWSILEADNSSEPPSSGTFDELADKQEYSELAEQLWSSLSREEFHHLLSLLSEAGIEVSCE